MKSLLESAKNLMMKASKACYNSRANFWQNVAILTVSVYHLCQIAVIGINKDTPKREKAFLIPQEAMDGVLNVIMLLAFAKGFQKIGQNLVKKGIIKPHQSYKNGKDSFAKEMGTVTNIAGSLFALNVASPIIRNKFGSVVQHKYINKKQENQTTLKTPLNTKVSSGLKI